MIAILQIRQRDVKVMTILVKFSDKTADFAHLNFLFFFLVWKGIVYFLDAIMI